MNAIFPSSSFQVRQLAQYGRVDAAIPGTVTLMQMGEAGTPYASILTRDLVTSALAGGGNLNLAAGSGSIVFGFDQGAGAVTLSVVQGELQVSPSLRTSQLDATFVNAQSVTQGGVQVATQADLAADRAASVTSFNQRTGDILLETADILRAGGAPQQSPVFSGWVTAPSFWDTRIADDTVVTANWVHRLICTGAVTSFNCRTGNVTLTTADVNAAYAVPGTWPVAPSPVLGDASDRIATTSFVDESLDGFAPTYSPAFSGIPTAPTAASGDVSNTIATTSFVSNAITSVPLPYLPLTGGTLTGNLTAPSATLTGSSPQISLTNASHNVGVGATAGADLTTGQNNVVIGNNAGRGLATGNYNTVIGASIVGLPVAMASTLILGAGAGIVSLVAGTNTFHGGAAGNATATGTSDTGIGYLALHALTTAASNTAVGSSALATETTGGLSTALGRNALTVQNGGGSNTALGAYAGSGVTTGSGNIFIGYNSGASITTGSNNTIIGNPVGITATTASAIVISAAAGAVAYDYNFTTAGVHTFSAPLKTKGYTVATLPATAGVGAHAYVTDGAASLAWGVTVTGGGSAPYLVWYNGTAWTVVGK